MKLRKFNDAILMYNRAIEINPNDGQAYRNKGEKFKLIFRKCTP